MDLRTLAERRGARLARFEPGAEEGELAFRGDPVESSYDGLPCLFEWPEPGSTWALGFELHPGDARLAIRMVQRVRESGDVLWAAELSEVPENGHGLALEPGVWNSVALLVDRDFAGNVRVAVGDRLAFRRLARDHEHPLGHGEWRAMGGLFPGLLARNLELDRVRVRGAWFEPHFLATAALLQAPSGVEARALESPGPGPLLRAIPGVNFAGAGTSRQQVVVDGAALAWAEGHWTRRAPTWERTEGDATLKATGPLPRTCHAVTAIGDGRVLVFGGELRDTHVPPMVNGGDTWIYEMATDRWRRVTGPGPPPRCHIGVATDVAGGVTFLQSGWFNPEGDEVTKLYADTWLFDARTETWRELPMSDPACRISDVQPVYDAARGRFVFLSTNSMWVKSHERSTLEWVPTLPAFANQGSGPSRGVPGEAMTWYDPQFGVIVRWGGYQRGADGEKALQNSIFVYLPEEDLMVQRAPSPTAPAPRTRGAVAYDTRRHRAVLFGGILGGLDERANDLWTYDIESNTWTELQASNPPGPRGGYFGMAYDEGADAYLVPFGRQDRERFLDEVWRLELRPEDAGRAFWWFEGGAPEGLELRATWAGDVEGELRVVPGGELAGDGEPGGEASRGWLRVEALVPPGTRLERLEWVAVE